MTTKSAPPDLFQPLLHDLVTTFAAPTQVLSDRTGDIVNSASGPGAQGIIHADVRVVSYLRVHVDGRSGEHIATAMGSNSARFTSLLRQVASAVTSEADPQLRLDQQRTVAAGLVGEQLTVTSVLAHDVQLVLQVSFGSDFAAVEDIKAGAGSQPKPFAVRGEDDKMASWGSGEVSVGLTAPDANVTVSTDRLSLTLDWPLTVPARGAVTVNWSLRIDDKGSVVQSATDPGLVINQDAAATPRELSLNPATDYRLRPWLERSVSDLNSLRMAPSDAPEDAFFAAGAPWYLTLFGRDSLWTARLLLPIDVQQAGGTLRALARLIGTKIDQDSGEEPGKIMHELRRGQLTFGSTSLPPLYYGTIDATPLWIILLHDAWRSGLDASAVQALLPALQAALSWLIHYGDADGDGFLEYVDATGHGLANQGWKDSSDSIRFADGSIAHGPVALCEVQGYAYQAATAGATLLHAFGLPGAHTYRDWAAALSSRFRAAFWCGEGENRYPALALDGNKRRVDSLTSNIGHLIGTGILTAEEEITVAERLTATDMDSGLGLRTMSTHNGGYSPLSYHCGSVWPHDTAIVIAGMQTAGLLHHAQGLIEGLLRASVAFDARLPELWSGEGEAVPYPAACRPQAWSAAAAITVSSALSSIKRAQIRSGSR